VTLFKSLKNLEAHNKGKIIFSKAESGVLPFKDEKNYDLILE